MNISLPWDDTVCPMRVPKPRTSLSSQPCRLMRWLYEDKNNRRQPGESGTLLIRDRLCTQWQVYLRENEKKKLKAMRTASAAKTWCAWWQAGTLRVPKITWDVGKAVCQCTSGHYSEIQSRGHLATNLTHRRGLEGRSGNHAEVFSHGKLFVVIKKRKLLIRRQR